MFKKYTYINIKPFIIRMYIIIIIFENTTTNEQKTGQQFMINTKTECGHEQLALAMILYEVLCNVLKMLSLWILFPCFFPEG